MAASPARDERHRTIESTVQSWLADQSCPGVSVTVVDGDETVFTGAYGNRHLDPAQPVTSETLFAVGSSTKPITATAVLTLVDDGEISLSDPVSEHVGFFEDVPGEPITVRDLLTHTSGMPQDESAALLILDAAFDVETDHELEDWEEFREFVAARSEERLTDRDRCIYYNSGYVVLSRLVESVSGTPFPAYVERNVFDPLGIERATFDASVLQGTDTDAMTPYVQDDGELQPAGLPDSPFITGPGGLLVATPDLGRFISACTTERLPLDPGLAGEMYEPVGTFRTYVDGTEWGYGYGWITRPFGEDELVGHEGGTGVSAGYLGFLRERGLGVAIGCNVQPEDSVESLAIELLTELTDVSPTAVLPERAVEEKAETVEGIYQSGTEFQTATVRWTGEYLELESESPLGGDTLELFPVSTDPDDYRFRTVEDDGHVVTVEFFVDGEAVDLLLHRTLLSRTGDDPDPRQATQMEGEGEPQKHRENPPENGEPRGDDPEE